MTIHTVYLKGALQSCSVLLDLGSPVQEVRVRIIEERSMTRRVFISSSTFARFAYTESG